MPTRSVPSVPAEPMPQRLREWAANAKVITVLTGAGMSAESGIPTFRDSDSGLWRHYDPMTLATPEAFSDQPDLVWGWYLTRLAMIRATTPNHGHLALARMARRRDVRVVTQNVDDLHERGGIPDPVHLHGRLDALRCFDCESRYDGTVVIPDSPTQRVPPPVCAACGGNVRPGAVWFGEPLPAGAFEAAGEALVDADLVLVVGTSGLVYPAAGLPGIARGTGVPVVEINPDDTSTTDMCDDVWRATAATALPALADAIDDIA